MEFKGTLVVTLAAVFLVLSSTGNADAEGCSNQWEAKVLQLYIPGPSTIIAGPGQGTTDVSLTGFGSFAVYDVTAFDSPYTNTAQSLAQCRGSFLVNSVSGTNIMMFYTLDFDNDMYEGSIVVAGSMNFSGKECTAPILGGSGAFASAKGSVMMKPIMPGVTEPGKEILEAMYYTEVQLELPKSRTVQDDKIQEIVEDWV